jgi:hypothetical protein
LQCDGTLTCVLFSPPISQLVLCVCYCDSGFVVEKKGAAMLVNCDAMNCGQSGLSVITGGRADTKHCVFNCNLYDGVTVLNPGTWCRVSNGICRQNGNDGIFVGYSAFVDVCNKTSSSYNRCYGVHASDSGLLLVHTGHSKQHKEATSRARGRTKSLHPVTTVTRATLTLMKENQVHTPVPAVHAVSDVVQYLPLHVVQPTLTNNDTPGTGSSLTLDGNYTRGKHTQHEGRIKYYSDATQQKVPDIIRVQLHNLQDNLLFSHLNGCTGIRGAWDNVVGGYHIRIDKTAMHHYRNRRIPPIIKPKHLVLLKVEEKYQINYKVVVGQGGGGGGGGGGACSVEIIRFH